MSIYALQIYSQYGMTLFGGLIMTNGDEWSTEIQVGEAIVDLLSGRIYRTLPIALKELVSNAWDADAENVQIFIHEDKKQIAIIDNGIGMTKKELTNYVDIAITSKPQKKETPGGRPVIGHYGIGVLSTLPFCRKITVQTTVKGSGEMNFLSISSEKWIDDEGHRKAPTAEELKVKCPGRTEYDDRLSEEHGTTVLLEDIFPAEWNMIKEPADSRKKDYMQFSGVDRIKWFLQQYVPIEYHPDVHPYVDFFPPPTKYKQMKLYFNGKRLYRNAIEGAKELERKENVSIANEKVVFRYLIVSPKKNVEPEELRGLQIRMKNVAIGLPTHFDIYTRSPKLYGRMRYIGGEIEILKGFENQLSLDRENIITCPEWIEFSEFFRNCLEKLADSLEDLAEAEVMVGALAISSGVPSKKAEYGFLSKEAVRANTKKKRAFSAKSKKKLFFKAKKSLEKIGYSIKETSIKEDPISVDHENKVVYVSTKKKEELPIIRLQEYSIFEVEDTVGKKHIAKMLDDKSIAFNYDHPLFDVSKDRKVIKELISIIYLLHSHNRLTDEGLKAFNRIILELYKEGRREV